MLNQRMTTLRIDYVFLGDARQLLIHLINTYFYNSRNYRTHIRILRHSPLHLDLNKTHLRFQNVLCNIGQDIHVKTCKTFRFQSAL